MLKVIPSGMARVVQCPASVGMEAPFPHSPAHPVTEEGKALHWATERVGMSWLPCNNLSTLSMSQFRGQQYPGNGVVITDEMVWAGGVYLGDIWLRAHSHLAGLLFEKQVSVQAHIEGLNGRTDALWRSADGKWLTIWDLKFGYVAKRAFENWQLLTYALGSIDHQTETVEIVVVQPRGTSVSRPVKRWVLPIAEFLVYAQRIVGAVTEARGPQPRITAGAECRYCRAGAICETLAAAGMGALEMGLQPLDVEVTNPEIAHEIELLDRATSIVRARLDALEALAISRIQAGQPVPGYGFRRGLGNRKWTQTDATIITTMREMFGIDIEAERKALSPAQSEGRGLATEVTEIFTERPTLAAKLVRDDPTEAREIFQK